MSQALNPSRYSTLLGSPFARTQHIFFIALALILFSAAAFAQTTYNVATTGSDGADGSTTRPLATIQRALDLAVTPGDTVVVRPGEYFERGVSFRASGTATQPITLRGEVVNGIRPTLNMGLRVPTWTSTTGGIYKGRPILNDKNDRLPELLRGEMRVIVGGRPLVQVRSVDKLREGTFAFVPQIDANNSKNNTGDFYVWSFGGVNPQTQRTLINASVYYSFYPAVEVRDDKNHIAIEGLSLIAGATGVSVTRGDNVAVGSGLTMRNIEIAYNWTYAIELTRFNDVAMQNSVVRDNAQNNWHRRVGIKPLFDPEGTWPHAIIGFNASNVKILDSQIHDNHGEGVGPFFGSGNWEIRRNKVYDNFSVNIYVDTNLRNANTIVDRNFVYVTNKYRDLAAAFQRSADEVAYPNAERNNNGDGIRVSSEVAAPNGGDPVVGGIIITNNVVQDAGGGIRSFRYDGSPAYTLVDSLIANNTVVGSRVNSDIGSAEPGLWVREGSNVRVMNNIVVEAAVDLAAGVVATNNVFNQNQYLGNVDRTRNILADPKFSGTRANPPSASSFQLAADSPAIARAPCGDSPSEDFLGRARKGDGKCDVGAFEFTTEQSGGISNGVYKISAAHSGKVIDVSGISSDDEALVHQWQYVNGKNQQWRAEIQSDGTYRFTAQHSGKVLDAKYGGTTNGTPVWQYTWNGSCAQRWKIEGGGALTNANGAKIIRSACSDKVLDVSAVSVDNGAPLQLYTFGGGANQIFVFERLSD
jgi:Ricin-type beta-trefoil lectin domain-like/Right handed beta helix region